MTKKIMFQGTGSSVGKSIMTAGFCRVLNNRGIKVAPFKSQNMALNSFITADGKEMGRAQVVQAEAARVEPTVDMNPILLKPSSDVGSQVILMGEVYKNMSATEYHTKKPYFKEMIIKTFNGLANNFDAIVIEGAGSPAEINLTENDIVNMGMANMVDSPVVIVGDIDRGGVFASIYGTYMLLTEEERSRIKGFIINKFRGDVELLKPGIKMLEDKINIPCLGVVPYFRLHIDDEDSVSQRFDHQEKGNLVVGIVKLPHISNFTDFTPFEIEDDVYIKYIKSIYDFEDVDLLIIPGSKNSVDDMRYLAKSGIKDKIIELNKMGTPVIGICGGYQMLGKKIIDDNNIESTYDEIEGLGLLEVSTKIMKNKCTRQISGKVDFNFYDKNIKDDVTGYEIHMGITETEEDLQYFCALEDGTFDGSISKDGTVIGTYLHGIFDNNNLRMHILNELRDKRNLEITKEDRDFSKFKDEQYDKLCDILEESLEVEKLIDIMNA